MAMFGRKKPMFGGIPSYATAGIGDDIQRQRQGEFDGNPFVMTAENGMANIPIGQAPVTGTIPMGQMQEPMQPQRFKPNILGVIGDAMQVFGGGQATYMQGMQAEQARAQQFRDRAAQQQQQRQMQREDMQWEWDNKPKEAPPLHRWESNDGSLMEVGIDGHPRQVYKDPTPKVSYQRVDNDNGTFTMHPVINGQIVGQGQTKAMPAPGTVMADPRLKGGSAPKAQGGF